MSYRQLIAALVNGHDIGGILRDVSPNNILLGADPLDKPVSGLLIDWHLSRCIMAGECEVIHPPSRPRQVYRTVIFHCNQIVKDL
jgi:serine/threonine protein kinase